MLCIMKSLTIIKFKSPISFDIKVCSSLVGVSTLRLKRQRPVYRSVSYRTWVFLGLFALLICWTPIVTYTDLLIYCLLRVIRTINIPSMGV